MAITRSNPDVGYFEASVFEAFAFSQVVRADKTVYISGVAPLRGTPEAMEPVATDIGGQTEFVLDVLGRCLASEGLGFEHVVAVTVYATDIGALGGELPLFKKAFGANPPSSTWVEISKLVHPDQLLEITATAVGP